MTFRYLMKFLVILLIILNIISIFFLSVFLHKFGPALFIIPTYNNEIHLHVNIIYMYMFLCIELKQIRYSSIILYKIQLRFVIRKNFKNLYFICQTIANFYSLVDDILLWVCHRNLRSVELASCRWCWQAWVTHGFDFWELVIPLG